MLSFVGADAKLFVFDYGLYRDVVVPAFLRLMLDGGLEKWLLELVQAHRDHFVFSEFLGRSPSGFAPVDFVTHCTSLDSELALTTTFTKPDGDYDGSWEARVCRADACLIGQSCPLHHIESGQPLRTVDDWLRCLELAVVQRCLGAGQFLGRSVDCFFYWDLLDYLGVPTEHPIRTLLERLGRRGFMIGYRGSCGTEGIHGWLRPDETSALAGHLFALKLPDYERSFVAMESFRTVRNILEGRVAGREFLLPSYGHPSASFAELSLSCIRTVCTLAAREGKGVLWGNNIA